MTGPHSQKSVHGDLKEKKKAIVRQKFLGQKYTVNPIKAELAYNVILL